MSVGDSAGYNNGYGNVSDAFHKEWKDACMKSDHPNTLVCPDKGVLKIEDEEYKDVAKDIKDLEKAAKYEIKLTIVQVQLMKYVLFYRRMKGRKEKRPKSKKGVKSGNQAGKNAGQTRQRFVRKRKKCKRGQNCKKKKIGKWKRKRKRRKGKKRTVGAIADMIVRNKRKIWNRINKMAKG